MKIITFALAGAVAVLLSACGATQEQPVVAPTPSVESGTPFLDRYINDLVNPPTPTHSEPKTWEEMLLPPA